MRKGQVSIEFIITIIFILFVFSFSLAFFQNRTTLNENSFDSWQAQLLADTVSRTINTIGESDNNSEIRKYIFWNESDQSILFTDRTIQVNYSLGRFSSAPFFHDVNNRTSEFNGLIIFKKENGIVVIENGD